MGCGNSKGVTKAQHFLPEKVKDINGALYYDIERNQQKLPDNVQKGFMQIVKDASSTDSTLFDQKRKKHTFLKQGLIL
jgi:hypothetical protein